jgi:membrane-bound lytic murein transglycosylase D
MSKQSCRVSPRPVLALAAVLFLAGCGLGRSGPAAPAPLPALAAEPEELGERPELLEERVTEPKRDILGSASYDLPVEANSWVEAELDYLVGQRSAVIGRWMERGAEYQGFIERELRAAGVPTDLYHLAMIESGMLPTARSRAGAVGFWQFMPATGKQMGLRVDDTVDERMDPIRSTRAAARHLRGLHREFNGDWALAAAAYNAGSGRISRGMKKFEAADFWSLAERGDLAEETRHYVPRLYAMTVIGRGRERFGFPAQAAAADFAYDSIHVEYATPLDELARMGASREALQRLNPHLVRGITPEGGYWVWVPAGEAVALQRAYLASDFRKFQGLGTYSVRPGDSLGKIANLTGLSVAEIRGMNPGVEFEPLQIGVKVKLPRKAAQDLAARAEERADAAKESGSRADGDEAEHMVREGESLWEIARRYDLSVEALSEANGLSGSTIRPGQKLRIPAAAGAAPAKAVEHVVQSGDTLWGIARKYDTSVEAIQSANRLGDRPIVPGQKLAIPRGK